MQGPFPLQGFYIMKFHTQHNTPAHQNSLPTLPSHTIFNSEMKDKTLK